MEVVQLGHDGLEHNSDWLDPIATVLNTIGLDRTIRTNHDSTASEGRACDSLIRLDSDQIKGLRLTRKFNTRTWRGKKKLYREARSGR